MKTKFNTTGFTLLELMIVLAILGIISAIAIPAYTGYIKEGRKSECRNEIAAITIAESQFFLENNAYFTGTGASGLQTASQGYYIPTAEALAAGTTNCTYAIVTAGNGYTITATGANKLAADGIIETKTVN